MVATYFTRLNGRGPFARLVDPTVDLVSVAEAQRRRGSLDTAWGAFTDTPPRGHEFILEGVGSLRDEAIQAQRAYERMLPQFSYHVLSDRAACLSARPLWLRPAGHPMLVIPVKVPAGWQVEVTTQAAKDEPWNAPERLSLAQAGQFQSFGIEIGLVRSAEFQRQSPNSDVRCGETTSEDLLIALVLPKPSTIEALS